LHSAQYVVQSAAEDGFFTQYLGLPRGAESLATSIPNFGAQVENVWRELRPATRNLVERAWQGSPGGMQLGRARAATYDARVDSELSRLLVALDDQAVQFAGAAKQQQSQEARRLANTCASLLMDQSQSAEVFEGLILRAHGRNDYAQMDGLTDALAKRLAPSEVCELARSYHVVVRALAQDVLTQAPAAVLVGLLQDPVDAEMGRMALERQANEYASEEARLLLTDLELAGLDI
jgi:hypothetical protein